MILDDDRRCSLATARTADTFPSDNVVEGKCYKNRSMGIVPRSANLSVTKRASDCHPFFRDTKRYEVPGGYFCAQIRSGSKSPAFSEPGE